MLLLPSFALLLLNYVILIGPSIAQQLPPSQPPQTPLTLPSSPLSTAAAAAVASSTLTSPVQLPPIPSTNSIQTKPIQSTQPSTTSNNFDTISRNIPTPTDGVHSSQPPTKPSMVQLTRTTAAQPTVDFPSTPSHFNQNQPSSPIINIDLSQTTAAVSTQPPTPAPLTMPTTPSITSAPTSMAQVSGQQVPATQAPVDRHETHNNLSHNHHDTVENINPSSIPISSKIIDTNSPSSPTISSPNAQAFTGSPSQSPTSTTVLMNLQPTAKPLLPRLPEARRIPDSSSSSASLSSGLNVQFLKPKSKFKCLQPTDCLNGGMCFNGTCFCPPGYTGESCAINIDECRQVEEPCFNNGLCVDEVNQYRCECSPGFKGDRCQEAVDMCIGAPCLNEAKCVNLRVDYTCECEPGWDGRHCERNIDECQKNPCLNNGTCHDLINDYRCDCGESGFTGKNCQIDFDDCAAKPCGFGSIECIDLTGDFKCVCYDGFTGKKCDIDIDECQSNPCENNGTCIEKSLNVHQMQNLSSDLTMYHEIRDHNLSTQINMSQYAGFTCECKEEYYGERCEEKKKCYTKTIFELCNHQQAECVNVGSSYECLINASFDGSGQNYAVYRINSEFKMREIYVKYRSLTGGVILSFETSQPESPIADLQLNKSGLYLSGAPIKRDENIKFDELLDGNEREIRLGLDTPTEIKSITLSRQSLINGYHAPFKGCLMQVRLNNQLVPLVDYGMGLNHSFELAENHLEVGQCRTCFEKDCLNHGHCEFQEGYDHCACPDTFTGNFCEIDVNECEKNFGLCLNGGTCENLHGGHRCNCKEGFRGEKCQEISDYCKAKQPCVTGTCKNVNPAQGTYQCECPSSHIGKRCDRKRDCFNECHSHHAQCINNVTCACLPGRREERIMCEYVASCEQVEGELCLNGGTCKNLDTGGYSCLCPEPFYGPTCKLVQDKPQFDLILLIVVTCVGFLMAACAVVSLVIFRSVRKARATRGTYSPSTQEKFGNSASDLLKLPQPERLI